MLLQGIGQFERTAPQAAPPADASCNCWRLQQLGEKRFVAIVRVGKQKFLIGGAAASVSLLAEIQAQRATVIAPRPLGQERA